MEVNPKRRAPDAVDEETDIQLGLLVQMGQWEENNIPNSHNFFCLQMKNVLIQKTNFKLTKRNHMAQMVHT